MKRADSEISAYKSGDHLLERSKRFSFFDFLYEMPNSRRESLQFDELIRRHIVGKSVLEIGCGTGWKSHTLLTLGARQVHGIDISEEMLAKADTRGKDNLRFYVHDIHNPIFEKFDLIIGRAILHHVDYQKVLLLLYENSLSDDGVMLFMEPLGESFIMRLYWHFGTRFHTPEERPFKSRDIRWLRQTFTDFEMYSYNYFSLLLGIPLSLISNNPKSRVLRACDTIDEHISRNFPPMRSRFRSAIFAIRKSSEKSVA